MIASYSSPKETGKTRKEEQRNRKRKRENEKWALCHNCIPFCIAHSNTFGADFSPQELTVRKNGLYTSTVLLI